MATEYNISTNGRSVINAGITDDYRQAIAELIWNGFDAGATTVKIDYYEANNLGALQHIVIADNGKGINKETLNLTFGAFLDSQKKKSFQRTSEVRGRKGKGRFSFRAISPSATWTTRYLDKHNQLKQYSITINTSDLSKYTVTDDEIVDSPLFSTGTEVHFDNIEKVLSTNLSETPFIDFICQQFAWFLCLNESKQCTIEINGEAIDYKSIIDIKEDTSRTINDTHFDIKYIRWNRKISDKFYFYMMNSNLHENCKVLTRFNNNNINFFHSIYITSSYFNNFEFEEHPSTRYDGITNQSDETYRKLMIEMHSFLSQKEKEFVTEIAAIKLINEYESSGILPHFGTNTYDQLRKKDLTDTIKVIYSAQPKIFKGLQNVQKKTLVAFLNLLLDSDERDKILFILDGIVQLSPEERTSMAEVLKSTSIRNMNKTVNMMHDRLESVECLKLLVFDLKKFTTERDHIQKIMEKCFWLFGEQYHLVSADKKFENALSNYLYILDGEKLTKSDIVNSQKDRRPDIFMCQKHNIPDGKSSNLLEENIIIELKRPNVPVGIEQYRQIEDYMNLVIDEPQFHSQLRTWKFFVVSTSIEKEVTSKYEAFAYKNKRFLVYSVKNYEIYAMTWDDVFKLFELNHSYILEKLNFTTEAIAEEVKTVKHSIAESNTITQKILGLNS